MTKRLLILATLVISSVMLLSGAAMSANGQIEHPVATPSISSISPASLHSPIPTVSNPGISQKFYYPPNFQAQTVKKGNVVVPLYSSSPAPMGIGSWGVENQSGNLTGYILNTSSFEGTISLNSLTPFYVDNDGPYSVSMQLNAILTNVTLFGNSSYVFWNQNVIFYSARTHTLLFIDNIWNFSSPSAPFTLNSLYNYTGFPQPPTYYYAESSAFNVSTPFTVHLFLNSTNIDGRNAVFFNYSLTTSSGTQAGSYDRVIFNSTYGMSPSYSAPAAHYEINGFQVTPTGYIPYDAELMIGGPGGGSTSSIYNINGTMTLDYLNGKSYTSVPSAYDFGTATGETSEGISIYWEGTTAHLNSGPSILYPMWNISSNSGYQQMSGFLTPSNGFIFMSNGTFNESYAGWAPVGVNGYFDYRLPPGMYSGKVLMSEYTPISFTFSSTTSMNITLKSNYGMGIYTPLYAMDNMQLQYISSGGNGTAGNPYVIYNNQYNPLNSLFWQFNDFTFPVFPGIMLVNTSAYVLIDHSAPFFFYYPSFLSTFLTTYGLPSFNFLQTELYNTSHVSIMNGNYEGWFTSFISPFYFYPLANIVVWNSTSTLVADNNFNSMSTSSLLIFGGEGNLVWGNNFEQSGPIGNPASLELGSAAIGLSIYSANNTIINNYFNVLITVFSPNFSLYSGLPAIYNNTYNISMQPSSYSMDFNGFVLTGSVVDQGYISGNTYWDAVPGVEYNDSGLIAGTGDYSPVFPTFYNVTVSISNLQTGENAFVYLVGTNSYQYIFSAVGGSTTTVSAFNGTYYLVVLSPTGSYSSFPNTVTVNGKNVTVSASV